jgi:hypothetical protein
MTKAKRRKTSRTHHSSVHWYNIHYWLQNGFLLPADAYSALGDLVRIGRFPSLDMAILEGIRSTIEGNASLLIQHDRKWIQRLAKIEKAFKDPRNVKPDIAGAENMRLLNQMYEAMDKVENKD